MCIENLLNQIMPAQPRPPAVSTQTPPPCPDSQAPLPTSLKLLNHGGNVRATAAQHPSFPEHSSLRRVDDGAGEASTVGLTRNSGALETRKCC